MIVGKRSSKVIDLEQNVSPHGAGGLQLFKFRAEHGLTNEVDKGSFTFFCHAAVIHTPITPIALGPTNYSMTICTDARC